MAEQDVDRSEQPTPYKLEQARKRGSVAKSADVTSLVMLAVLALALYALPERMLREMARLSERLITLDPRSAWTADTAAAWLGRAAYGALEVLAPLLFLLAVAAVLANVGQTGFMFSPLALKPNFAKLNPATGLKRFFSLKFLFDAGKSSVKLVLLLAVSYLVIKGMVRGALMLGWLDPRAYPGVIIELAQSLCTKLLLALLALALIDLVFSRWDFMRQMHMSRRELRDEIKNREGDPRIRQKLRQLRIELLRRARALKNVPGSDVLLTNPTHIAVALRYRETDGTAPQLVAKGAGELAQRMRSLARRHGVPIVENRTLARALYREVEFDSYVPERWYPDIARILVWVFAQRAMRANAGVNA